MTPSENPKSQISVTRQLLPLSLLNDYLYCPRRAALKVVEGWRSANQHTERGDIVHEHSDLAGYEVVKGVTLLRALPVWSDRLGLNGKCDILEQRPQPLAHQMGEGGRSPGEGHSYFPVEFKLGKRRQWENDDAQLCAQALCLEEMFSVPIPSGAVFHADSKRRREVEFNAALRQRVEQAVAELHGLLDSALNAPHSALPAAAWKPACEECSLFEICLPKATENPERIARANGNLFRT